MRKRFSRSAWALISALLGLCVATTAFSAPEEIQVYMDDLSAPGQFGLDVHNNYVLKGDATAPYPGGEAPEHVYRLTPEFYYGLTTNVELGLYLLTTTTGDGHAHFNGEKIRIKYIAPHDTESGLFWGANLEVGRTDLLVSATPWNSEIKGILGYRRGPWTFVFTPNIDLSLSSAGGPVTSEVDGKVAYTVTGDTQLGIETYNELGPVSGFQSLSKNSQTVYLALDSEIHRYEINAGIGRGLTSDSDRWVIKCIIGTHFGGL